MKILFLYTRFDKALKEKVKQLEAHNAEVSTLSLLEYKLKKGDETADLEPASKLEFLEKSTARLRLLNRIYKRKKMVRSLEDYDIIDLYECEQSALFIVDEIREKCYDYFITCGYHDTPSLLLKPFYSYLYNKARFLLFNSHKNALMDHYAQKSRLIYDGIPLFDAIDKITQEDIFKASYAMGFDLDKEITYVHLQGALAKQLAFIEELLTLPQERLRQSTFIFYLNAHNLQERKAVKALLEEKNFDYLLIEVLITAKQHALLYKIADKSIILSAQNNSGLPASCYAQNHTYLYHDTFIDPIYKEKDIFIDTFENFKNHAGEENSIIADLCKANQAKVAALFSPSATINQYIEVLKEV